MEALSAEATRPEDSEPRGSGEKDSQDSCGNRTSYFLVTVALSPTDESPHTLCPFRTHFPTALGADPAGEQVCTSPRTLFCVPEGSVVSLPTASVVLGAEKPSRSSLFRVRDVWALCSKSDLKPKSF